jgi:hypothetical protein
MKASEIEAQMALSKTYVGYSAKFAVIDMLHKVFSTYL